MTTGTRVRHVDDQVDGTVTGSTRYLTGHTVPVVRWDDRSSTRVGAVTILDQEEGT